MPPPIEERVAYLEGKVEDHSRGFEEIRDQIANVDGHILALDQKVDGFRTELASHIDAVDQRIGGVDQKVDRFREELTSRIDAVDQRIGSVDQKADRFREELTSRIDAVDQRIEHRIRIDLVGAKHDGLHGSPQRLRLTYGGQWRERSVESWSGATESL